MAYTQGCFEMDAATGHAAIYLVDPLNPTDSAPFTDPNNNRLRILFHSAFDYLKVVYDQTISVTFPAVTGISTYSAAFPAHSLGAIPYGVCKWGSSDMSGAVTIQSDATGFRQAYVNLTTTGASIESWANGHSGTLASVTHSFRLILLGLATTTPALDKADFNSATGLIQLGQGKFTNTGGRFIRITNDAVPLMYLNKIGPSMDTLGYGVRTVAPDGTVTDIAGYAGSFTATGAHKVKV